MSTTSKITDKMTKTETPIIDDKTKFKKTGIKKENKELKKEVSAIVGMEKRMNNVKFLPMSIFILSFFFNIKKFKVIVTKDEIPIPIMSAFIPINLVKIKIDENIKTAPTT